jgi:hypothetical protein
MNNQNIEKKNMTVFTGLLGGDLIVSEGRLDAAIEMGNGPIVEQIIGVARATVGNKKAVFIVTEIGPDGAPFIQDQLLHTLLSDVDLNKWLTKKRLLAGF